MNNKYFRVLKILRPVIQFGLFSLAFWIALTRISDYFHHPTDVVAGGLLPTKPNQKICNPAYYT
jgi:membrane-associated phospholipid phosphatase